MATNIGLRQGTADFRFPGIMLTYHLEKLILVTDFLSSSGSETGSTQPL
jgi:hypothetical protein